MRQVRTKILTVTEANELLGVDMEPGFWEALVRMISYPEVQYVPSAQQIRFPDYVPFEDLAREWIEGIEQGVYEVRPCEVCGGWFDLDRAGGIFGKPEEREAYVCRECAERMTAREYYERYVRREGE